MRYKLSKKTIFYTILSLILLPTIVIAASKFGNIEPLSDITYYFGNVTLRWIFGYIDNVFTENITATNITVTENITAEAITAKVSCSEIWNGTDTDFCADATGAAAGVNYWGADSTLQMIYPNETAIGSAAGVNLTNQSTSKWLDASALYEAGVLISSLYNRSNTTDEVWSAIANGTYVRINVSIHWNNITARNLSIDWVGTLDWGNITNAVIYNSSYEYLLNETVWQMSNSSYDYLLNKTVWQMYNDSYEFWVSEYNFSYNTTFNSSYDAILGKNTTLEIEIAINETKYFNIQVLNATDLICTNCIGGTEIAELADADISDTLTCSDLVAGSEVVADTEVVDDITVTSTKGINTTLEVNATRVYSPIDCFNSACTRNRTTNSTHTMTYG